MLILSGRRHVARVALPPSVDRFGVILGMLENRFATLFSRMIVWNQTYLLEVIGISLINWLKMAIFGLSIVVVAAVGVRFVIC